GGALLLLRSGTTIAGTGDDAVVVESKQFDHVANVVLVVDTAGGWAPLVGENRMRCDPVLGLQSCPEFPRKAEVGDSLAVEVTDLAPAELERQFTALFGVYFDAWPRRHLLGDALAGRRCLAHDRSPLPRRRSDSLTTSSYKLKF